MAALTLCCAWLTVRHARLTAQAKARPTGGSWNNTPQNLRAANRDNNGSSNRNNNVGFRVASTAEIRVRRFKGRRSAYRIVQGGS
jgi:formylglycine-generating enzyme required for sulfatase activity